MSNINRIVKAERKRKYKNLRRIRKARDMASQHTKQKLLLSNVYKFLKHNNMDEFLFTKSLAKYILDKQKVIIGMRIPKPQSAMFKNKGL